MTAAPPNPTPAAIDFAGLEAASQRALGHWTKAWGGLDAYALARESMGIWTCAGIAWTDYLGRMAACAGPLAAMDAGAQLMTDSFEICSRAAAARLKAGGVKAPLLNDA